MFRLKTEKELVDFGSGIGKIWIDRESMVNDDGVETRPNGVVPNDTALLFKYNNKDFSFEFALDRSDRYGNKIDVCRVFIGYALERKISPQTMTNRINMEKYQEITKNIEAILKWSGVSEIFNWRPSDDNKIQPISRVEFVTDQWLPVDGW